MVLIPRLAADTVAPAEERERRDFRLPYMNRVCRIFQILRTMKHHLFLTALLALSSVFAPMQAEAQGADNKHLKRHNAHKGKRVSKTNKGMKLPAFPPIDSDASAYTAPAVHPQQYSEFLNKLNEKVKANETDICEALAVMLSVTKDEFSQELWMAQAAKDGNAIGMHYLGMTQAAQKGAPELRYLRGKEREILLKKQQSGAGEAAAWLKCAADKKYAPAMLDYSVFLRNGIGVLKNEPAANRLMLEAAKSGSFDTRFSWLLQSQRLISWADKDRPEVAGEINRGNHQVIYYLSRFAPDSRTQLEWLQKAAAKNGAAMYALSAVFHKQDPVRSLELLKSAVALHDPGALFVYGSLLVADPTEFHQKTGLKQNTELGLSMLRLSCMLGNSEARRLLSRAYYRGELGIPQSKEKAYRHIKWLNSAQRDPIALTAQGFMMLTGEGTQQDIETGKRYITIAANSGYSYALVVMAYAHYKGIGTPKNVELAIEKLQEAAAAGFPHAYLYIAFLTAKGLHGEAPDARGAERYVNIASLNLRGQAKAFFDTLMQEEDWVISPFPLEKQ